MAIVLSGGAVRMEELIRLRERAEAAYARARLEVFDHERPGSDPASRAPWRQRLVDELDEAERELREVRAALGRHAD